MQDWKLISVSKTGFPILFKEEVPGVGEGGGGGGQVSRYFLLDKYLDDSQITMKSKHL